MHIRLFRNAVAMIALVLASVPVIAHTTLASSSPPSNATIENSPPTIDIQFRDPAKLTAVVAIGADKSERRLEFAAGDKANSYVVQEPNLPAGRNEIKWTALSHDGHVIRGTLVFIVKPAAKQN